MTSMFSFISALVIFEDNDTKSDTFGGPLTFVENVAGMFYNQNIRCRIRAVKCEFGRRNFL